MVISLVQPEDIYQRFAREYGGISLADLVSNSTNPPLTVRNWQSATVRPSATANTAGTPIIMYPSSSKKRLLVVLQSNFTFAGTFNSEAVTALFTATFDDNSTQVWGLFGVTSAQTAGVGLVNLAPLMRDDGYIKSIAVTLQSNIANSQVTGTAQVIAHQA